MGGPDLAREMLVAVQPGMFAELTLWLVEYVIQVHHVGALNDQLQVGYRPYRDWPDRGGLTGLTRLSGLARLADSARAGDHGDGKCQNRI